MLSKRIAAFAAFALACAGVFDGSQALAASFTYDQPLVNGSDGGLFSNDPTQLTADRFVVPAGGATISQVSWYGAAFSHLPFSAFSVQFFADSAGTPGTQLTNIAIASPTVVDTGLIDSYFVPVLHFSTAIPDVVLAPGTYYFSVSDSGPVNFVWASSNLPSGGFFRVNNGPWTDITTNPNESARFSQAFTLNGEPLNGATPLPAALPLFAGGLGALGLFGWRRKKKSVRG